MGERPPRLVVNADDFGLSPTINEGIVHAHQHGIVTAASLMATGNAFSHAVRCCRLAPSLDVGVHLTLVADRPLLKGRSLAGSDGRFPASAGAVVRRWLAGSIRRQEVAAEWAAQIDRVLAEGLRVTHLDSHQHLHVLPGLAGLSLGLAARYRIPWVRVPVEPLWGGQWSTLHGIRRIGGAAALGVCWLLARLAGSVRAGYRPLSFLGFHDGGRLDGCRLGRRLQSLRPGRTYELMCHPGLPPDDPEVISWAYRHAEELRTLCDPSIRALINERGIRLCSYADLAA